MSCRKTFALTAVFGLAAGLINLEAADTLISGGRKSKKHSGRGLDIARVDGEVINHAPSPKNLRTSESGASAGHSFNGKYRVIGTTHRYGKHKSEARLSSPRPRQTATKTKKPAAARVSD